MPRQITAGAYFALIGAIVAYLISTEWIGFWLSRDVGYFYLLNNVMIIESVYPDLFTHIWMIFLALSIGGAFAGAHFSSEALTREGTSSWQTKRQLKRNRLLGDAGTGFVLAKLSDPERRGAYITSSDFPNCLIIAPTGAGKGVGFVYPNLLTFEGSVVVLDVKGENFNTTARWRKHHMENEVYKFAPVEFGQTSHRYNPLQRIGKLNDYAQVNFELRKIATLFLQSETAGEWLQGAIQLFVALGGVAFERGTFTLGEIYEILAEGTEDIKPTLGELAQKASEPGLRRELMALAKLENKTLASYQSVLSNAGFDKWSNDHVAAATSRSDFNFDDLRRKKTSVYFVIKYADIKPLAPLVRLFFNELVATIQSHKPGKDEPHPVMIILDEFHLLGKMSEVANAMTTIRGFNGRIAIITQTIPVLDAIYSYEERLSIQGGAGLKLYMTPSEELTIEDLSKAVGMTTKRTVSKSRQSGLGERTTYSEKTEERPLLTEDDARRLPSDTSIIIVNGKQPVKAKAIVHHRDPRFTEILREQEAMDWDALGGPHDSDGRAKDKKNPPPTIIDAEIVDAKAPPTTDAPEQSAVDPAPPEKTQRTLKDLDAIATRFVQIQKTIRALPDKEPSPPDRKEPKVAAKGSEPIKLKMPEGRVKKRPTRNRAVAKRELPDDLKPHGSDSK